LTFREKTTTHTTFPERKGKKKKKENGRRRSPMTCAEEGAPDEEYLTLHEREAGREEEKKCVRALKRNYSRPKNPPLLKTFVNIHHYGN